MPIIRHNLGDPFFINSTNMVNITETGRSRRPVKKSVIANPARRI